MDASLGATAAGGCSGGGLEVEDGIRTVKQTHTQKKKTKEDGQYEFIVLHRGYGFRRLPAEKFLHIVSVVVTERGELPRKAR